MLSPRAHTHSPEFISCKQIKNTLKLYSRGFSHVICPNKVNTYGNSECHGVQLDFAQVSAEDGTDDADEKDHQLRQELRGAERRSPSDPPGATPHPQLGVRLTTGPASAASAAASRHTSGDSASRRPQGLRHCGTTGTTGVSESRMAVPKLSSVGSMVPVLMQAEPARGAEGGVATAGGQGSRAGPAPRATPPRAGDASKSNRHRTQRAGQASIWVAGKCNLIYPTRMNLAGW